MITTENSSGLISGAKLNKEKIMPDKKLKVTVIRPFRYNGERLEIGTHEEFKEGFAREMLAANKVVLGYQKVKEEKSAEVK
jgi:hypothetical protein